MDLAKPGSVCERCSLIYWTVSGCKRVHSFQCQSPCWIPVLDPGRLCISLTTMYALWIFLVNSDLKFPEVVYEVGEVAMIGMAGSRPML
jgi:hypothetical protein